MRGTPLASPEARQRRDAPRLSRGDGILRVSWRPLQPAADSARPRLVVHPGARQSSRDECGRPGGRSSALPCSSGFSRRARLLLSRQARIRFSRKPCSARTAGSAVTGWEESIAGFPAPSVRAVKHSSRRQAGATRGQRTPLAADPAPGQRRTLHLRFTVAHKRFFWRDQIRRFPVCRWKRASLIHSSFVIRITP